MKRLIIGAVICLCASVAPAQNSNSSSIDPTTSTPTRTRTVVPPRPSPTPKTVTKTPTAESTPAPASRSSAAGQASPSGAVLAAFNSLLDGIRNADVKAVTSAYQNTPRLLLFNYNGTVTKGWDQMKANRESSYPKMSNVNI